MHPPEFVILGWDLVFQITRTETAGHDVDVGQRGQLLLRDVGFYGGESLVSHHFLVGRRRQVLFHLLRGHRSLRHGPQGSQYVIHRIKE